MEVLAPEVASGSKSPFGPEPLVRKLRKVSWYFRPALFPSIERGILSDNQTKTPPKTPPFFLVLRSCAGRSHFYLIATLFRSRSRATFPLGVPASGHFAVAVLLVEATRTPDLLTTARGGPKCICTRATKHKKNQHHHIVKFTEPFSERGKRERGKFETFEGLTSSAGGAKPMAKRN